MPWLEAIGAIADEDVRRVGPTLPMGVIVDDLDGLFFEQLHIRIKIQQQEKVALQRGLERRHPRGTGVGHEPSEVPVVFGDRSYWHEGAILRVVQSHYIR